MDADTINRGSNWTSQTYKSSLDQDVTGGITVDGSTITVDSITQTQHDTFTYWLDSDGYSGSDGSN